MQLARISRITSRVVASSAPCPRVTPWKTNLAGKLPAEVTTARPGRPHVQGRRLTSPTPRPRLLSFNSRPRPIRARSGIRHAWPTRSSRPARGRRPRGRGKTHRTAPSLPGWCAFAARCAPEYSISRPDHAQCVEAGHRSDSDQSGPARNGARNRDSRRIDRVALRPRRAFHQCSGRCRDADHANSCR